MVVDTRQEATRPEPATRRRGIRADLIAGAVAGCLVVAASLVGTYLDNVDETRVGAGAPPLFAAWMPHYAWGSLYAVLIALAVVSFGPVLAERLRWGVLLFAGYVGAVGFTIALAMVDGWRTGLAERLIAFTEYLHDVPTITDIPRMLAEFTSRIPLDSPASWTTHVAGHPPGATLLFVWLDRIGLGGGGAAAIACVLLGCLAAVAVPVTLRAVASAELARASVPFLVLFPGAVWIGASGDAAFTGISSAGIAVLAVGAKGLAGGWRVLPAGAALAGGVLLGYAVFMSYGLVLLAPLVVAVVALCRGWRALLPALVGAVAVLAVFTAAGFWWLDGYHALIERYYLGLGATRSYAYWVWADLACLVFSVGPVLAPGVRRAVLTGWRALRSRSRSVPLGVAVLVLASGAAVAFADISGLSKAEVERIWLPFAVWLVAGATLLPPQSRRWWLAGQALTALLVNHLLLTSW
ncbi:MAG: hypothetical protein ACRDQ5_26355 [Sciscionella sp.]